MAAPTRPPRQAIAEYAIAIALSLVAGFVLYFITFSNPPIWWKHTPFHSSHKSPISAVAPNSSSPTVSQPPESTSPPVPAQPASQVVDVPANVAVSEASGGFDTGIHLQRDQQVLLSASGSVFYGYEGDSCAGTPQTGPDGHRAVGSRDCGIKYDPLVPAPEYPVGCLLWRVGPTAWQEAGASKVVVAPTNGDLYLGINDDTIEDNQGSFVVSVSP
jgi:hypothetical protein